MPNAKSGDERHATDGKAAPKKRRRRPNPGDVRSLRRTLWSAIRDIETLIHDPPEYATLDQRLRAVHALASIAGVYLKATEQAELVDRIEALEAATQEQGGNTWHGR